MFQSIFWMQIWGTPICKLTCIWFWCLWNINMLLRSKDSKKMIEEFWGQFGIVVQPPNWHRGVSLSKHVVAVLLFVIKTLVLNNDNKNFHIKLNLNPYPILSKSWSQTWWKWLNNWSKRFFPSESLVWLLGPYLFCMCNNFLVFFYVCL